MKIYQFPVATESSIIAEATGNTPGEALKRAKEGLYRVAEYGDLNSAEFWAVDESDMDEVPPAYPADADTLIRHVKEMYRILMGLNEWEAQMGGFETRLFEDSRTVIRNIQDANDAFFKD